MKRTLRISMLGVLLAVLVAAPVSAQAPGNPGGSPDATTQAQQGQARGVQAREDAQERRQRIQAEVEERREEVQQRVCEQRQERLQDIIPRLGTSAVRLRDVMDDIYDKVQGFYEDGPLTVENYDELADEVDSAQVDAHAAVEVVEDYEFELDCEEPGVGQQLDGFRQAVTEAREELKSYRAALVELISSLRAEAADGEEETSEQDGDDTDTDEDEDEEEEEVEDAE